MSQQQPHQPYPYSQHGEWIEATSVHPSIEQRTDHYAAQQVAPRFHPVPLPVQKPPKKQVPAWVGWLIGISSLCIIPAFLFSSWLWLCLAVLGVLGLSIGLVLMVRYEHR